MSIDPEMLACPICGGDRTSIAIEGELYCVECNRMYPVVETHMAEYGFSALAPEPQDPHGGVPVKRAA